MAAALLGVGPRVDGVVGRLGSEGPEDARRERRRPLRRPDVRRYREEWRRRVVAAPVVVGAYVEISAPNLASKAELGEGRLGHERADLGVRRAQHVLQAPHRREQRGQALRELAPAQARRREPARAQGRGDAVAPALQQLGALGAALGVRDGRVVAARGGHHPGRLRTGAAG